MQALAVAVLAAALVCGAVTWVVAIRVWRTAPGAEKDRLRKRYWTLRAVDVVLIVVAVVTLWVGFGPAA